VDVCDAEALGSAAKQTDQTGNAYMHTRVYIEAKMYTGISTSAGKKMYLVERKKSQYESLHACK
jgi:hypothetical protein